MNCENDISLIVYLNELVQSIAVTSHLAAAFLRRTVYCSSWYLLSLVYILVLVFFQIR